MTPLDTAEIVALAERVEAATGPDRDLDALMAPLAGLRVVDEGHPLGRCCYDGDGRTQVLPSYTRSIDAAIALIPIREMRLLDIEIGFEPPHADVWPAASVRWYPPRKEGKDWHAMVVTAATLPLTIAAAALRARASLLSDQVPNG